MPEPLTKEERIKILSKFIEFAQEKIYNESLKQSERNTWSRLMIMAMAELNRLTEGEREEKEDLASLISKLPKKELKRFFES